MRTSGSIADGPLEGMRLIWLSLDMLQTCILSCGCDLGCDLGCFDCVLRCVRGVLVEVNDERCFLCIMLPLNEGEGLSNRSMRVKSNKLACVNAYWADGV
jgi:hypothetical protein